MRPDDRIVIIGGGPGGLSAARAYRETGGRGEVTILTTEPYPPYRRPPLTKEYLRGEVERDELPMQDVHWFDENDVKLRTLTRALTLDRDRGVVETETDELPYDACVLATGSEPVRIPIPGGEDPEVLVMRTIDNSERLRGRTGEGSRALVVGSGFIGCEAAVSLSLLGTQVSLISQESVPQEQRLGPEVGERVKGWLESYGVDLRYLGTEVEGIERENGGFRVTVEGGESISTGTVLFGTGVSPRMQLAEEAKLEIEEGGVVTDSSMRTSGSDIFAVGDIAFAMNESAGERQKVEHWGEALEHGRIAGTVLAGGEASWSMAPGFWSTMGEKTLKYWSWSGGWDEAHFVDHVERGEAGEASESFTVWYGRNGVCVGVLAHNCDKDYEEGREIVEGGALLPR
jgi:NADPH-dependent 2,4-dienoyl-CoA reductase/sulfur reductase-like enzyme